jgi:hypothetical protein
MEGLKGLTLAMINRASYDVPAQHRAKEPRGAPVVGQRSRCAQLFFTYLAKYGALPIPMPLCCRATASDCQTST